MFGTGNRSSHPYLSYADNIAVSMQDAVLLVARIMLGIYFLTAGWQKILGMPAFANTQIANGVPMVLAYVAPFCEFLGGLALVVGFATRYVALALFLFTIIATYLSHRYWTFPRDQQRLQYANFWKNVTIMGGFLALFVAGPGRFAVDRFLRR